MKILQALLCLTLLAGSDLFGGDFIIKLKNEKMKVDAKDFYIAGVIDGRADSSIGYAMLGMFNSKGKVKFEKKTSEAIYDFISYSIPMDTLKTPVYIKILFLEVKEDTRNTGEYALINMALGFYKKEGDLYGELAKTESRLERASLADASDLHEGNIRNAIEICLNEFASKELTNITPVYTQMDTIRNIQQFHTSSDSLHNWRPKSNRRTPFMFYGLACVNSFGCEFIYSIYRPKGDDWVYPVSASITLLGIKKTDKYTDIFGYQCSLSLGALKPIGNGYKFFLNGSIPVGTETIKYYNGDKSSLYIGLQFSQSIIFNPGNSGFGISIGIEEGFKAGSKLHPWDVGFKIGIGGGF